MKKVSWWEIINSDLEFINLIWYWSLINSNTHKWKIKWLKPVLAKWFKRIYNLKVIPYDYTKEIVDYYKWYGKKYWVDSEEKIIELSKWKECVLNCLYTWNSSDYINGLLLKIDKESFEEYSKREIQYSLYKAKYHILCPNSGDTSDESKEFWYILIADDSNIINDGIPFLPYHNNVISWAYDLWKSFWEIFEKTTKI